MCVQRICQRISQFSPDISTLGSLACAFTNFPKYSKIKVLHPQKISCITRGNLLKGKKGKNMFQKRQIFHPVCPFLPLGMGKIVTWWKICPFWNIFFVILPLLERDWTLGHRRLPCFRKRLIFCNLLGWNLPIFSPGVLSGVSHFWEISSQWREMSKNDKSKVFWQD